MDGAVTGCKIMGASADDPTKGGIGAFIAPIAGTDGMTFGSITQQLVKYTLVCSGGVKVLEEVVGPRFGGDKVMRCG